MRKTKFTDTPAVATVAEVLSSPSPDLNIAAIIQRDSARQEFPPSEMPYNQITDEGLASRRSKHVVRTHAEVKAATQDDLSPAVGLSLRAPMAGQCENDQWSWQTDRFGKQRS